MEKTGVVSNQKDAFIDCFIGESSGSKNYHNMVGAFVFNDRKYFIKYVIEELDFHELNRQIGQVQVFAFDTEWIDNLTAMRTHCIQFYMGGDTVYIIPLIYKRKVAQLFVKNINTIFGGTQTKLIYSIHESNMLLQWAINLNDFTFIKSNLYYDVQNIYKLKFNAVNVLSLDLVYSYVLGGMWGSEKKPKERSIDLVYAAKDAIATFDLGMYFIQGTELIINRNNPYIFPRVCKTDFSDTPEIRDFQCLESIQRSKDEMLKVYDKIEFDDKGGFENINNVTKTYVPENEAKDDIYSLLPDEDLAICRENFLRLKMVTKSKVHMRNALMNGQFEQFLVMNDVDHDIKSGLVGTNFVCEFKLYSLAKYYVSTATKIKVARNNCIEMFRDEILNK